MCEERESVFVCVCVGGGGVNNIPEPLVQRSTSFADVSNTTSEIISLTSFLHSKYLISETGYL